jgi:uncharacterized protein (TIGR02145 family)
LPNHRFFASIIFLFQSKTGKNFVAIIRIVAIVFLSIAVACCSTRRLTGTNSNTALFADSILVDSDGNKYPTRILLDGKLWMMADLKLNVPNSYCYENLKQNCDAYGRLYTWESAQQGCKLLGEGWRLPTAEEGKELTRLYGGGHPDSIVTRKNAYKVLVADRVFITSLGGGRNPDGTYARMDAHGFYWTATDNINNSAWYFNFAKGSQAFFLQTDGEKVRAFSVRCVKSKF